MTRNGTQTIELKSHTNHPGSKSDECSGSSFHDKLNSSFRCIASF